MMKEAQFTFVLIFALVLSMRAQELPGIDKSSMDMSYFPDNFVHDRRFAPDQLTFDFAVIRVTYSRPAKNGRNVFGELVPYGEVWRNGANETPEIKFYKDIYLSGERVKAGIYALLSIPDKDKWTIILSNDLDQWGAYSYNKNYDQTRVSTSVTQLSNPVENFTIQFEGKGKGIREGVMKIAWDQTLVSLPFTF